MTRALLGLSVGDMVEPHVGFELVFATKGLFALRCRTPELLGSNVG